MIYYIQDEEGNLIGFKYNNTLYYYIKNMQEDIIGITDNNYNLLCSYEYDSWGKLISIKDNNGNIITNTSHIGYINPFRYRSYYYDNETKLYYLNSRYYNPEWGRFINADSYLGVTGDILGYNLYLYASNNPINNSDEEGHFFKKAWNWVKKKASQAAKKVSKAVKKVKSVASKAAKKVEQIYTSVKESFVFEAEVGFGFGYHTNVARYGIDIGFEKTVGYDNQRGSYTSTNAGGNLSLGKIDFGLNAGIRNYDGGNGNPMAMPWEVWDDENTIKDITIGLNREITANSKATSEAAIDSHFVGIDFGLFVFAGFRIKIGFNIGN